MKRVDDFRLRFGRQEYVPIMIGGMGVDIDPKLVKLSNENAAKAGVAYAD